MNITQLRKIAEDNFELDTFVRIPMLRTIVMETRYSCDPIRDLFYFDSDKELIKIKHYSATVLSGKIRDDVKIIGSRITRDDPYYVYMGNYIHKFRAPKVGDTLVYIDNKTGTLDSARYTIISANDHELIVDKDITQLGLGYTLIYIHPDNIQYASSSPLDMSVLLGFDPISDNTFDVYIDLGHVVGLDFQSAYLGA